MKIRILLVSVIIGIILLFGACATSSKNRDFSPHAPLALVTIVANEDINWLGEQTFKSDSSFKADFVRDRLGLNEKENITVRNSSSYELIDEA